MTQELERAFQAINAYNGLCVPPNTSKEAYMVSIINNPEPYKHVIKETAKRIYNSIQTRKIVPADIQNKSTLITHTEAMFLKAHCQVESVADLNKFVNGPFND